MISSEQIQRLRPPPPPLLLLLRLLLLHATQQRRRRRRLVINTTNVGRLHQSRLIRHRRCRRRRRMTSSNDWLKSYDLTPRTETRAQDRRGLIHAVTATSFCLYNRYRRHSGGILCTQNGHSSMPVASPGTNFIWLFSTEFKLF